MKIIKKVIYLIITITLVFFINTGNIVAAVGKAPEMSVDQNFDLNSVCLLLNNSASTMRHKYTEANFPEVEPDYVLYSNPLSYDLVNRYVNGENVDLKRINLSTFKLDINLCWNEPKTKEEIIEIVNILKNRSDVEYATPNYYLEFQMDSYSSGVTESVWTNFYRIEVIAKDDTKYVDLDGNKIYMISAKILECYDDLAKMKTDIDRLIKRNTEDDKIEFGIPERYYKVLQCGYEYIIQLSLEEKTGIANEKEYELLINKDISVRVINIFDHKLFFKEIYTDLLFTTEEKSEDPRLARIFENSVYTFSRLFNDYAFKCRAGNIDELTEYFDLAETDFGRTFIFYTEDEEIMQRIRNEVGSPDACDVYYGIFLLSGDDVAMFGEYIKVAAKVRTSEIYKFSDCAELRKQALERIKANK